MIQHDYVQVGDKVQAVMTVSTGSGSATVIADDDVALDELIAAIVAAGPVMA